MAGGLTFAANGATAFAVGGGIINVAGGGTLFAVGGIFGLGRVFCHGRRGSEEERNFFQKHFNQHGDRWRQVHTPK